MMEPHHDSQTKYEKSPGSGAGSGLGDTETDIESHHLGQFSSYNLISIECEAPGSKFG